MAEERAADDVTVTLRKTEYYSKDHLGSIVAITNDVDNTVQRLSYDVWGKRRNVNGAADPDGALHNPDMYHGYTGHEMLDAVGLIHMNGRLFDPLLGRFVSADPNIQDPLNLQSYNRYAYCMGDPMGCTDPSGYFSLGRFLRTVAAIAITVWAPEFIGAATGWGAGAVASNVAAGALSGAVSGGNLQSAITGGITAGLFMGLHEWKPNGFFDSAMKVSAHGTVGGISSVLQGGDFKSGFVGAAVSQTFEVSGAYKAMGLDKAATTFEGRLKNAVAAAVLGGTASAAAGGNFANGAVTGAFSRLFNDIYIVEYDGAMGYGHLGARITGEVTADHFTDGFYPRSAFIAAGFDPTDGVIKNDMAEGGKTAEDIRNVLVVKSSPEQDAAFNRRFYSSARSYDFNSNQNGSVNCATRILDAMIYAKILPSSVPRPIKPKEVMHVIQKYAPN